MTTVYKSYKRPFSFFVKKQSKSFRAAIEDEINSICSDPLIGEQKIGDLSGIFIHKFKFKGQQHLIAYSFEEYEEIEQNDLKKDLQFYKIGSHENFYEDVKDYLRSIGWYK
jgi:hypothetical protein